MRRKGEKKSGGSVPGIGSGKWVKRTRDGISTGLLCEVGFWNILYINMSNKLI